MDTLPLPFSPRYIILTICAVVTMLLLGIGLADGKVFDLVLIPTLIFAALTVLGIRDLTQKSHAVLRNYPISAHIRFLLEVIRPEMRQYFFESEKDGMPFSRDIRAVVVDEVGRVPAMLLRIKALLPPIKTLVLSGHKVLFERCS